MTGRMIAVFGASGHTGRFVMDELERQGLPAAAVGRDAQALAARLGSRAEPFRVARIDDPSSLDAAFADAAVVINCAGPFIDTCEAVIAAALRAGAHYLDVAAEQETTRRAFGRFDSAARSAGVAVLPAVAFYGGLGDLLVTAAMGDWKDADEVTLAIALDSWKPTAGTRITGERNTFTRMVIDNGGLVSLPQPPQRSSWSFTEPFGRQPMVEVALSEAILVQRHLRLGRLRNLLNETPLDQLNDLATPPPTATDERGRSAQLFRMEAVARRAGAVRRAAVNGRDIYAVTAPLVCEAAARVLAGEVPGGAHAPGEVFEPEGFLRALSDYPLEVVIGPN